jgi:hypothetical protein
MITIADIEQANAYVKAHKSEVVMVEYRGYEVVIYEVGDELPSAEEGGNG